MPRSRAGKRGRDSRTAAAFWNLLCANTNLLSHDRQDLQDVFDDWHDAAKEATGFSDVLESLVKARLTRRQNNTIIIYLRTPNLGTRVFSDDTDNSRIKLLRPGTEPGFGPEPEPEPAPEQHGEPEAVQPQPAGDAWQCETAHSIFLTAPSVRMAPCSHVYVADAAAAKAAIVTLNAVKVAAVDFEGDLRADGRISLLQVAAAPDLVYVFDLLVCLCCGRACHSAPSAALPRPCGMHYLVK